jgi:hypothetical protein
MKMKSLLSERPAIVMKEREHLVRTIKDGLRKIEEHDRKIEEHETKRDEREVEVGAALKALKAQKPNGIKWERYLEDCGIEIHRSRADQLIRIADGRTTVEEELADTAERVAKSRTDLPIRIGENAGDPEASAADMKAQFAALDDEDIPPQAPIEGDDAETAGGAEHTALDSDQTKQPSRAEVAKLVRAWVKASPEAKREFVRERWDEIARARKQLDANGADHEDRWIEGDDAR